MPVVAWPGLAYGLRVFKKGSQNSLTSSPSPPPPPAPPVPPSKSKINEARSLIDWSQCDSRGEGPCALVQSWSFSSRPRGSEIRSCGELKISGETHAAPAATFTCMEYESLRTVMLCFCFASRLAPPKITEDEEERKTRVCLCV